MELWINLPIILTVNITSFPSNIARIHSTHLKETTESTLQTTNLKNNCQPGNLSNPWTELVNYKYSSSLNCLISKMISHSRNISSTIQMDRLIYPAKCLAALARLGFKEVEQLSPSLNKLVIKWIEMVWLLLYYNTIILICFYLNFFFYR